MNIRSLGSLKEAQALRNKGAVLKAKGKPGSASYRKASDLMMKQIDKSIKGSK